MSSKFAILILVVIAIIGTATMFFMFGLNQPDSEPADTAVIHKKGPEAAVTEEKELTTEERIQGLEEVRVNEYKAMVESGQLKNYEETAEIIEEIKELRSKETPLNSATENTSSVAGTEDQETQKRIDLIQELHSQEEEQE